MKNLSRQEEEFEDLLKVFSESIRAQVLDSGLMKRGIDPEDIIQEIKARLWKRLASEKKLAHPPSYIKKVVSSVLIDEIRKARMQEKAVRRTIEEKSRLLKSSRPNQQSDEYIAQALEEAVGSLVESRRRAVKLFLFGLTVEEISSVLRWSQDKTRNLVYRGLADIKEILSRKGVEYED